MLFLCLTTGCISGTLHVYSRKGLVSTAPVITIFVRHSANCKHAKRGEFFKGCQCRKHFRWTQDGKQVRQKAGTRTWAEAEDKKAELLAQLTGKTVPEPGAEAKSISDATALFLDDRGIRGVSKSTLNAYKVDMRRMRDYFASVGVFTVQAMTAEHFIKYCGTWPNFLPSSYSRFRMRERLSSFLKFCYEHEWIRRIPPLPKMVIDEPPTLPLTDEEYNRLLAAIPVALAARPRRWAKARALIQLMRWSGLAIRDAAMLPVSALIKDGATYRIVTKREKTGTDVSVVLPPEVAAELLALDVTQHPNYFFWNGKTDPKSFSSNWATKSVIPVFTAAGIKSEGNMKSHRLRDTFAVHLLQHGVPMEDVSKLLGHTSIRTTEKHYAKWVKGRQDRLDSLVTATWEAA